MNVRAIKNDTDGALADFTQAIHLDPKMAAAYDGRGNAQTAKRRPGWTRLKTLRRPSPSTPARPISTATGVLREQAGYGNLDGAIADYTQALALKPNTAVSYYNRGLARQAQGNLDAAIVDYDHALALDPAKLADAYYNRGNAKNANHDLDGAIADYTQALALNPKLAIAYCNRGLARQAKGDMDGALADYTRRPWPSIRKLPWPTMIAA